MKIQLMSDLHLEAHPDWMPQPAPNADLLVLAGDIGSYQPNSRLADTDFGLARFSPRLGWPTPVLLVPGNHEYDGMDFDEAQARLRDTCERLDIVLLERAVWTYGNVRILGTTLWSDFDALCDPLLSKALQAAAREKAFRAANFYLRKACTTRAGTPWLAEDIRIQAQLCQSWLRDLLHTPFGGTTVVATHFAPSLLSADPRYGHVPGTAGFCNRLDELLPLAKLWLHGHLHAPSDYVAHGCRVVANPLGYARKNEQVTFNPTLCVEP